ncbi:carbon-nitrogen hydrolase family protein [Hoeflea sp. G2-23]|uniref:Carbon-nitrogen hydrolase family protein n=1 Tax=Hoeflea algicola TaxID=2983763 RepID=A0ABT3ZBX3_9HYPH|nr:carbon-nitrogen hydrolase family protein [Hoeflea algicola]MCY0149287.1 carbon-nitrogen hydrolase family protein [Hoeflea algicola]
MTNTVTVAVAQVPAKLGDVRANLNAMDGYLREAAAKKAKLLILPECYLSGYMFDDRAAAVAAAISANGSEIGEIVALCAKHDVEVVVGFLETNGGKLYNSAAVLGAAGVIGIHRKRHLPHLGADRFVDEPPGTELSLFETCVGKVGVAICYEIRFPEIMRSLALAGADFIALPTNWPVQSVLLAEQFTRVRAAENFIYLLVANRADTEGDATFLGQSQIVDPLGGVIANSGRSEGLLVASVDVARARNKTITIKAGEFEVSPFKDRRPATYRIS